MMSQEVERMRICMGRLMKSLSKQYFKNRQEQKSDRINSDRQSGSDQLGSTQNE